MKPFCAICTSERGPFSRHPLGKGDALVNVCERCDSEEIVPVSVESRVEFASDDRVLSPQASRLREHRQDLVRRGLCKNGEKHGKATHGQECDRCYAKSSAYFDARREQRRASREAAGESFHPRRNRRAA